MKTRMKIEKHATPAVKNNKAFTMIEIMMAIFIVAIIGSIIAGSFISGNRIRAGQDDIVTMQQNIRVAFHILSRDLRMAGYEIAPNWNTNALRTANQINETGQAISFSYIVNDARIDADGDGAPDAGQIANFTYSLNGTDLVRFDGTSQLTVASNINCISFSYLDNANNWSATPTAIVKAVGITVIAQSPRIDSKLPAVSQNHFDSFITDPERQVIYTSPADQRRRRTGSIIVNLRNFMDVSS
ncbi:MAG: prepilin-type N-terminal cleavage/methylation domain-containing protein [Desulfobacteraceae bacterium]